MCCTFSSLFFFLTHTATTAIYPLSLHDALPISDALAQAGAKQKKKFKQIHANLASASENKDRKSTRLNSSHRCISYAVFCLKKKKPIEHRLGVIFRVLAVIGDLPDRS